MSGVARAQFLVDETNYKIKKLYNQKKELIDKLSILDTNFEEKFEVDVLYHDNKEYLVDPYNKYTYS